jgi:hypothetical protein
MQAPIAIAVFPLFPLISILTFSFVITFSSHVAMRYGCMYARMIFKLGVHPSVFVLLCMSIWRWDAPNKIWMESGCP